MLVEDRLVDGVEGDHARVHGLGERRRAGRRFELGAEYREPSSNPPHGMSFLDGKLRNCLAGYSGLLFTGYALRAKTIGSVHVTSADPGSAPLVSPRYLEHDEDRAATGAILDHARRIVSTSLLAASVEVEVFPWPSVANADDVIDYSLCHGRGVHHAVGACAMGPVQEDVVDSDLRVRGVSDLRVVDASVLPFPVSGDSVAPVMALAWIAAGRIAS